MPKTCPRCRSRYWNVEKVVNPEVICLQCGYKWIPRTEHPGICPACHRDDWNKIYPVYSGELTIAKLSSKTQTTLTEDEEEQEIIMKSIEKRLSEGEG